MTRDLLQLVLSGRLTPEDAKLIQQAAARICLLEEDTRERASSTQIIEGLRETVERLEAKEAGLMRRIEALELQLAEFGLERERGVGAVEAEDYNGY